MTRLTQKFYPCFITHTGGFGAFPVLERGFVVELEVFAVLFPALGTLAVRAWPWSEACATDIGYALCMEESGVRGGTEAIPAGVVAPGMGALPGVPTCTPVLGAVALGYPCRATRGEAEPQWCLHLSTTLG